MSLPISTISSLQYALPNSATHFPSLHVSPSAQRSVQLAHRSSVPTHTLTSSQYAQPTPLVHCPSLQILPSGQRLLHAPQWSKSLCVSRSMPPHSVLPTHCPAEHICPVSHALSHAPQLAESDCTSMHDPWHNALPVGHAHFPCTQTSSSRHFVLIDPQASFVSPSHIVFSSPSSTRLAKW